MKQEERMKLAEWVMETALKSGADQAAVSLSNQREIEIEFRDKQLDKLKESGENSLDLSIYADQKYSAHSTCDLRKETLKHFIDEAVKATKYLSKDEFRTLPDPKLYPTKMDADLKVLDKDYEKVDSKQRVKLARETEAAAMAQSDKIISSTSYYTDSIREAVKVNSNGFRGATSTTTFSLGAEVTVDDGQGGRPEDWVWLTTRQFKDLPTPQEIGKQAAERALVKVGQEKLESGKYTMIVENRSAAQLLQVMQQAATARALQQKRSYLDGMLDQQIASDMLTIIDDPTLEKGLGSRFYDGEGIASKKRVLIEKGILKTYLIDNYYGKKLGMEINSGSTSNIVFEQGDKSQDELIATVEKGIFVTGFLGGNANSTTGDFSYGISGQLIENGNLVKPVNEMNISGNAKDFWKQLVAVGNDPYIYSSIRIPTLMFEDVEFSGI